MKYHMISLLAGFILDLCLGDPYCLPHPIRLIGTLIAKLDQWFYSKDNEKKQFHFGIYMVLIVLVLTFAVSTGVLMLSYFIHPIVGCVVESIMCYQILATKCLKDESMKVYARLKEQDLQGARTAVSMIVGRDTDALDEVGVAKAAIETVAENTSDGVIAPLIYCAIGGPIVGFLYKAINTMDSMVGYKNDRYLYFGRAAAKLDDVVNFLPARISAGVMIVASFILQVFQKEFDGKRAIRIYKRDHMKHKSPNSAHTEAVCAGALGIQLAGDAIYFGKVVKKDFLGDCTRKVEIEDIKRANQLLYGTAILSELLIMVILGLIWITMK